MTEQQQASWDSTMNALRLRYTSSLVEHNELLASMLPKLEVDAYLAPPDVDKLVHVSHKLAGSSAIYGFQDLSDLGRSLEHMLIAETGFDVAEVARVLRTFVTACDAAIGSVEQDDTQQHVPIESVAPTVLQQPETLAQPERPVADQMPAPAQATPQPVETQAELPQTTAPESPAEKEPSSWDDAMKTLKLNYINGLAERKELLASFLPKLEVDAYLAPPDVDKLVHVSHKLAGSSAIYGFQDLSDLGRRLEHMLTSEIEFDVAEVAHVLRTFVAACDAAIGSVEQDDTQQQVPIESVAPTVLQQPETLAQPERPVADQMPAPAQATPQPIETRAELPSNAVPENQQEPVALQPANTRAEKPLVLVVDDDPNIQVLLCGIIEDMTRTVTANSAIGALEVISNTRPDLVLLDERMPGEMSGVGLLEHMQQDGSYDDIPVIMITGSDKPEAVMRALMAGAVDYVAKPFDPSNLRQKLQRQVTSLTKTILIADDDLNIRDLLEHKFKTTGCRLLLAESGLEAYKMIGSSRPDLILLDRMMPGMDGITILRLLKENPETANIPVVLLTAKRREEDIIEGFEVGATDYIVKPFNPDEVVARCMRLLSTTTRSAA